MVTRVNLISRKCIKIQNCIDDEKYQHVIYSFTITSILLLPRTTIQYGLYAPIRGFPVGKPAMAVSRTSSQAAG